MVQVEVVATEELGDRSYLAHDGRVAVVIDPQRDIDRIEAVLTRLNLRCVLVVETHIHNDYVSGGYQLAKATGADCAVSAHDAVAFDRNPVHDGFGSFCSAGSTGDGPQGTLADELKGNDALTEPDETRFVERLVAGLTAYPAYYAHMGARNCGGPAPIDLSTPELVEPEQLAERITAGEWVVDLRDRTAYATDHVAGTIGIDHLAGHDVVCVDDGYAHAEKLGLVTTTATVAAGALR